jgi:hypothetical protein
MALNLFTSTKTTAVLLFNSEHWHKMSTRTSTVCKYVKELYMIPKEHRGAREHQAENPCSKALRLLQISSEFYFTIFSRLSSWSLSIFLLCPCSDLFNFIIDFNPSKLEVMICTTCFNIRYLCVLHVVYVWVA